MPLLVAAGNGHSDIVQLLLKHGASVNAQVGHVTSCDVSRLQLTFPLVVYCKIIGFALLRVLMG